MSRANPLDAALEEFEPQPRDDKPRADRTAIEQLAKENGFVSRDARKLETAATTPPVRRQRRFTTGRNMQINIKATAETIARFNALAEALNLPAGALLERAVEAMEAKQKR